MSFPCYESYKHSGVEWLDKVPEHWEISPLKRKIRMRYGDALANDVREDGEIEVFGSNGSVGLHSVPNTKAPAIIVGRKGSYGKIVWAENGGFVIDTAYLFSPTFNWLGLTTKISGFLSYHCRMASKGVFRPMALNLRLKL